MSPEKDEFELYSYTIEKVYYNGGTGFTMDPRLQRDYRPEKANKIAADFDPNALGTLSISERPNGLRVCLDGQHRTYGATMAKWDGFDAKVYRGLTVQQEAKLFRQLNNTSKVAPAQAFKIALVEERPTEVRLQRILEDFGLRSTPGYDNSFFAIQTGLTILERRNGEENLRWAFRVATGAWGPTSLGVPGQVVNALSQLHARYGSACDTDTMIRKLAVLPSGADYVAGQARTLRQAHQDAVTINYIRALINVYNLNLRKFRLPEWQTRGTSTTAVEVPEETEVAKVVDDQGTQVATVVAKPKPPRKQYSGRS